MPWVTEDRFFFICDNADTFKKEFAELQELVRLKLGKELTEDNWQPIMRLYMRKLALELEESKYERTISR